MKLPWNGVNGLDFPASRLLPDSCVALVTRDQVVVCNTKTGEIVETKPIKVADLLKVRPGDPEEGR